MKLEKNQKLVIIGDSISDCGRGFPVGEKSGIGNGYIGLVDALLLTKYPYLNVRVINMGISGNTVRNLKSRWKTDLLDLNPDWVGILIGVNDVWRQFDSMRQIETHVYIEEYEQTLEELIQLTQPKVKGMILMTPYFMEPLKEDAMRVKMDEYGAVVKKLGEKYNLSVIDLQALFDEVLKYRYSADISWDRIHPNLHGHMVIAQEFVRVLEQ